MAGKHYHHGNTPAAWTGVIIMIIGFCVGSAYTVMAEPLGVAAGGGIVALGGIVGLIMRAMGLGQGPAAAPQRSTDAAASEVEAEAEAEAEAEVASTAEREPGLQAETAAERGADVPGGQQPQQAPVSG